MTTTLESLRLARLAMYQLRQDVGVPETVADAASDTSVGWTKCKECFDVAFAEVIRAHDWYWKRNAAPSANISTTPDNWPDDAKNALVYCLAGELAVPVAGRVEDMKNCRAIYAAKLREARVHDLETELAAVTDDIHKQVVRLYLPHYGESGELPHSIKEITDRIDAEKAAAQAEVFNAHDWARTTATATADATTNWSAGMKDALVYLLASKLAIPTGRKEGEPQMYDQLYRDKLAQARVAALQAELDAISDALHKPVLRLILPNFTPQDTDLPRSIKTYTDRIDAEKAAAQAEVFNAHDWARTTATATADATTNWSAGMKDALVYLLASKLAIPTGRKEGEPRGYDQLYRDKLAQARVAAIESERNALTDPIDKELVATVLPCFSKMADPLPRSVRSILDRADAVADSARVEILTAHNWSFARVEWPVQSCGCDPAGGLYQFTTPAPPRCARLLECYTPDGRHADWKLVGQMIRSVEPIESVIYLKTEERVEKWPPLIRSAYVSLLAADIAATVAGSPAEADRLRKAFAQNLENARLVDSRSTGSRREPRGRNYYADAMLRPSRRDPFDRRW